MLYTIALWWPPVTVQALGTTGRPAWLFLTTSWGQPTRTARLYRVALRRSGQKVFACLRSAQRLRAASLPDPDTHGLAAPRVLPIEAVSQRGALGQKLPASPPELRGWTRFRPELDVLGSCDLGESCLRVKLTAFESA